jgi:hypothetical protein
MGLEFLSYTRIFLPIVIDLFVPILAIRLDWAVSAIATAMPEATIREYSNLGLCKQKIRISLGPSWLNLPSSGARTDQSHAKAHFSAAISEAPHRSHCRGTLRRDVREGTVWKECSKVLQHVPNLAQHLKRQNH